MKSNFKKKTLVLMACVLAVAVLSTAGILANFWDMDRAKNKITIGYNEIRLVEDFKPPAELVPGVTFTKDVKVKNVGPNTCFVRVMAVFADSAMEQHCTVDWNKTDWAYNETDGYWYYIKPVAHGETTVSLFTTVSVKDTASAGDMKDFDMLVYAESYQSYDTDNQRPFASYEDAWANYRTNRPK